MKNQIPIILALPLLLIAGCEKSNLKTTPKEAACSTLATVKDLTGLDACGYVLQINDKTILEVVGDSHSSLLQFKDGDQVYIDYDTAFDVVTACMAGIPVNINCIQPAGLIPECIKNKIAEIKEGDLRNPPGAIYRYTYHNEKVYYIPPYCCDIYSSLLDEACHLICSPDGGFSGKGDGKCKDFFDTRTNEQIIWKDERSH